MWYAPLLKTKKKNEKSIENKRKVYSEANQTQSIQEQIKPKKGVIIFLKNSNFTALYLRAILIRIF